MYAPSKKERKSKKNLRPTEKEIQGQRLFNIHTLVPTCTQSVLIPPFKTGGSCWVGLQRLQRCLTADFQRPSLTLSFGHMRKYTHITRLSSQATGMLDV